jgi:hypothetical protein
MINVKCSECGKRLGFLGEQKWTVSDDETHMHKHLCTKCYFEYQKKRKAKKTCYSCAFFGTHEQDVMLLGNVKVGFCKKLNRQLKATGSTVSDVFGVEPHYDQAEKCVHYMEEKEYTEKFLKGEIGVEKETSYVVCRYCDTRYDANTNVKCPNCDAVNR